MRSAIHPAQPAQDVQRTVHVSDRGDESSFVANEQHAEQRHTQQDGDKRHGRRDQPGFAERADQIGRRKFQGDK